ncbi:hypothetical protein CPLU01_16036 [Colletotrichum plurivorum]|uniref:Uncharacterized protein n=1 Tax=Colletotrichum plurivorum TaxID=2175906 RepID=A0A8H6J1K6_9PEZI|nr:hypothetical protein CPLU01_16036 [Colletotrichum plurivorum]
MQATSLATGAAPSLAPRDIRRAIDWRPKPIPLADKDNMTAAQGIQTMIESRNKQLLSEDFLAKKWKKYLRWAYKRFHSYGERQVALETAVYYGLMRLCGRNLDMPDEDWATASAWESKRFDESTYKDEGYADWLETDRPDFYAQHTSVIRQPFGASGAEAFADKPPVRLQEQPQQIQKMQTAQDHIQALQQQMRNMQQQMQNAQQLLDALDHSVQNM